jgi:hypothetical protein
MIRPTKPAPVRLAALLVAAAVVAGCASDDEPEAVSTTTLPGVALPSAPDRPESSDIETTTTPAPTTAAPTTPAPTTAPPTTPAPTAPPTTAEPTPPPTTEPVTTRELILSGEGVGSALFGAEPEGVIDYVSSILGSDTADTGWVAPDSFAVCEGTTARRVDWGTLSLLFTDQSRFAGGRRHFIGYEYGRVGGIGDEPVGLRTPGGLTLGSRVIDLLAEFPEAKVNEGDEGVGIPDNFYISNVFYGLLTGTTADDYVTVLFGGYGCGE